MKIQLFNDNFENAKVYQIPKAQMIIADIPYNLGANAYASNPQWYNNGDIMQGESKKANSLFFRGDENFNIYNFFRFCTRLLKEDKTKKGCKSEAPCILLFCSFKQMHEIIEIAEKVGFKGNIPLFFIKNYSAEVLKANMRVVGAMEYGILLYKERLPKFNNEGKMIFNYFNYIKDSKDENIPKIHPTQKPVKLLKRLIEIFTDEGDVIIDPVAGSGTTLKACKELNRSCYGFEINKEFYNRAINEMLGGD